MALPTSSEAIQYDLEGSVIRSKWCSGDADGADVDRLWRRLDRGLDLGASALIRDIGADGDGSSSRLLPPGARGSIAAQDTTTSVFHHGAMSSFKPQKRGDATHWIEAGSVAIPMFVRRTESPVLIVTFHGVLQRTKYVLPRFEWVNSLRRLGHSIVSFGDPTMDLDPQLEGGWWLGTPLLDLVPQLATLVSRVVADIGSRHLIIAGSSMGGFGALQLGAYFPNATVVAFNPQTDVRKYHVRRVTRVALGSVFGLGAEPVTTRVDVLARYAATGTIPSRIRYVINSGDQHHIEEHYEPFINGLGDESSRVIHRTVRDDGPGHTKIPADVFVSTLMDEVHHSLARQTQALRASVPNGGHGATEPRTA